MGDANDPREAMPLRKLVLAIGLCVVAAAIVYCIPTSQPPTAASNGIPVGQSVPPPPATAEGGKATYLMTQIERIVPPPPRLQARPGNGRIS